MRKRIFIFMFALWMAIPFQPATAKYKFTSLTADDFYDLLKAADNKILEYHYNGKNTMVPVFSKGTKVFLSLHGASETNNMISSGYFNENEIMVGWKTVRFGSRKLETVGQYVDGYKLTAVKADILEEWMYSTNDVAGDFGLRFVDKKGTIHELIVVGDPKTWRSAKIVTQAVLDAQYFAFVKPTKDFTVRLLIDNDEVSVEQGLRPYLDKLDNRVYVPLRLLAGRLPGLDLSYNAVNRQVTASPQQFESKGYVVTPNWPEFILTVNSPNARINGQDRLLDVAPRLLNGNIYLPLAAIQLLNVPVQWNSKQKTVSINLSKIWDEINRIIDSEIAKKEEQDRVANAVEEESRRQRDQEARNRIEEHTRLEGSFIELMNRFEAAYKDTYNKMSLSDRSVLADQINTTYLAPLEQIEKEITPFSPNLERACKYLREAIEMILTQPDEYLWVILSKTDRARTYINEREW